MRGTKRLDLYELARVDRQYPVEENIKTIAEFVAEEKVGFIGMSECRAETLRRGHSVHPIALVEIEVSPWSYDQNVKDGEQKSPSMALSHLMHDVVVETSRELGVAVAAYSYADFPNPSICAFLISHSPVLSVVDILPASLRPSMIYQVSTYSYYRLVRNSQC